MRKIYFVKYNNWSSAILCADQIAEALRAHGHDAWSVGPRDVRGVRDAIFVFVKIARWWHVARARRNRNITVYDVQDALAFDGRIKNRAQFDAILWRNRRQFEDYGRPEQTNRVLHQHWDPRYTANRVSGERLAVGYFGHPNSFVHWGRVPDVDCFKTDYFRNALGYNCHLSVRLPGAEHLYKPNCKVSTAAACNANLITTRDASSVEMLGEDYPF